MKIFEHKKLERDTFRKLRDRISLNQRENVEKNVRLNIDSFVEGYKNIGFIAIYWPLKNEVDIRSLKKKFTVALPRCKDKKELLFYSWDENPLTKQFWMLLRNNSIQVRALFNSLQKQSQGQMLIFSKMMNSERNLLKSTQNKARMKREIG